MNTSIGSHEHYALVSPQDFKVRMDHRWSQELQLITSPNLLTLWGIMASTFRTSIISSIGGVVAAPWLILQPPTGTGKTRGACLYAAMQAETNATQSSLKPVGILIVTRLIADANAMAQEVNELSGRKVAIAHHSDKPASAQELLDSDILVITHQAYVNSMGRSGSHSDALTSRFTAWSGGNRLLTIIDEALANVVENNKVTVTNIGQVISYITPEIRHAFPEQVRVLEYLHQVLASRANPEACSGAHALSMLWDDGSAVVQMPDMVALQRAMKALPYDTLVLNEHNESRRDRIWRKVRDVISQSEAVMEQWAYYARKGNEHSINSASFLIPWDVPGPVVLDATAHSNFLWDLFEGRSQTVPTPSKVRDYSTATLHIARASGLGKHSMVKNIQARFPRLLHALEAELSPERSVFLCMHKDAEHVSKSYVHKFSRFSVGHWGAVDGSNAWETYDTAVIFGLPYRDSVWSTSQFFALQGHQDDVWLQNPVWREHQDVRRVMEQQQLSISIIQAINRVCVRRVIDTEGRCPSADIYIVLPNDKTGDAILQDILADMPNLRVVPWAFELDGPKVRKARSGTSHEALITLMTNRLPGQTAMSHIQRELGLDRLKLKKLKEALGKSEHPTTTALREIGVRYVGGGVGRGSNPYLIKDLAA